MVYEVQRHRTIICNSRIASLRNNSFESVNNNNRQKMTFSVKIRKGQIRKLLIII
jgi:hypothetical protein